MAKTTKKTSAHLDKSQARFFADKSRVQVVCWHRQKGKDYTAAAKAVMSAMETGQTWYIVSLTQRQADETFDKCIKWAKVLKLILETHAQQSHTFTEHDESLDREFEWKARELRLPNGGKVVSLPGRNPNTLAGFTGNIILTEFALFPNGGYEHWAVLFPIITRGGYQVLAISTPRGRNTKFYELWNNPELYSVHTCDIQQSVFDEGFQLYDAKGKPFDQSTLVAKELAIAQFRKLYGDESKWPREYECKFTGDLEALVKYAQLQAACDLGRGKPFDWLRIDGDNASAIGWSPAWFKRDDLQGGRLELGWDVARTGHLASLWCNFARPMQPKQLRFLMLMHKTSFAQQRDIVRAAMRTGDRLAVGAGDATGMGMDSNETLKAEFGERRWLPINFGGRGKSDLGSIALTAFDGAGQGLPPMDGPAGFIAADLAAIQADRTGGQLRLDEGQNPLLPESHCDIAYSGMLALKAGSLTAPVPGIMLI